MKTIIATLLCVLVFAGCSSEVKNSASVDPAASGKAKDELMAVPGLSKNGNGHKSLKSAPPQSGLMEVPGLPKSSAAYTPIKVLGNEG